MYQYDFRPDMTTPFIVSFARGDVNGDRIPDNVYLTGTRTPDSPFVQNITLVVQNGATGMYTSIPLKDNAGYNPNVSLYNFTGGGAEDILIGIATGGSGGIMIYYIYSFVNNIAQLLFDYNEYNAKYTYDVIYKDNYRVEVLSKTNKMKYILDITYKGTDYLNEIYDRNGKLKAPISGFVDPVSGLYPVDFDSNGVYELLAYQKIAGRYHADSLGYVLNTLKWQNNMFVLDNQEIAIEGMQL
jgi:hypothetical protein